MIPTLINTNNNIKFTRKYSLIISPSTAIPERLPIKNICEISSHNFLYRFIASTIITITIVNIKSTATIAIILINHASPFVYAIFQSLYLLFLYPHKLPCLLGILSEDIPLHFDLDRGFLWLLQWLLPALCNTP